MLIPIALGLAFVPETQAQQNPNIDSRVEQMLSKLSLEQKIDLIGGVDAMFIRAVPEVNFPRLKMSDGPMGVRTWGPTTGYAAGIGLAASFDTGLAKRVGISLGRDARSRGVSFLLAPGVNIYRSPTNGRNFEYYGEDPFLAGRIAVAYIQGVQSQGVIATVKHYAANNSEYDRHNVNSILDERTLREIYLPVFEAAVKEAHVGAVMDSYNLLNGEHATQNAFLNLQVLKKEWGFRGILMSDWTSTYDGVAAANAGLDLEMPFAKFMNRATLLPAIQQGKVSVATIDDKVRRILRTALEFGLLDRDQTELLLPRDDLQSRQVALESAEKSAVLLRNEGNLLPLDARRIRSIAVIGPGAWPAVVTAGGSAEVTAFAPVSFAAGLSDALAATAKVYWSRGVRDLDEVLSWYSVAGRAFSTDSRGQHPGLTQQEFRGDFTGKPEREATAPAVTGWGSNAWGPPSLSKRFIRWSGYYIPKKSGVQRFIVAGTWRDAYTLYVNAKQVLHQPGREGQSPRVYDLSAPAGAPIAVRLDYVQAGERIGISLGALPAEDMLEPEAIKLAAMSDVAVVCAGFNPRTESEGSDRTYSLPPGQDELIRAVLAANPRTILVLTAGGGVDTSQWLDRVPALLQTWYAGQEGGRALPRILFGEVNPSGKLPMSWERRVEDNPAYENYYEAPGTHDVKYGEGVFLGYRHYDRSQTKPLFPFGFGLSYTTFEFSNLSVTPAEASADSPIAISFDVRNTGLRAGAEVAQVYIGDPSATLPRPVKELKGFARVELKPGETQRVSVTLDRRSLAYWDVNAKGWRVDPGRFVVYVGNSSANVPLQQEFTVR
jgi:beta-glucosidase